MDTRTQALRFRIRRHHLAERVRSAGAAAATGLQDTPPGTAAVSLSARADADVGELVIVPSLRGAAHAVALADLAVFTVGREPPDEVSARALIGNAWRTLDGMDALEALDRVSDAVADSLRPGPLARDDFHQALRERLPAELLTWCEVCGSRHVHSSLWRATSVRGVLAIVGREGRSAVFGAPPPAPPVADPGAELARRYLRAYAPADPNLLGWWAGITRKHADRLWERAGELVEAGDGRWALADDAAALRAAEPVRGVRLLANLDPLLAARDRELLVPDEALRKRVFRAMGGPGVVLAGGEVGGLWRAARKGRRLVLTVEALGAIDADALEAEAQRLASLRGADRAEVVSAG